MRDMNATSELNDGTLRIHRRRPGICQPKDSLGLSCILQANNLEKNHSLYRRKTLTVPQDNIGISCLPTKDSDSSRNTLSDTFEVEDIKNITLDSRLDKIVGTDKYLTYLRGGTDWTSMLTSNIENLNSDSNKHANDHKKELDNTTNDIGISNIRRPRSDKARTRKPILPKDNIGLYCRLLQKPTILKANIGNMEKKITKATEKQQKTKLICSEFRKKTK